MLSHRTIAAAFFWLLAQPPFLPGGVLGTDRPLAEWTAKGRFDTRAACEEQLAKRRDSVFAAVGKAEDPASKMARAVITESRCVDSSTIKTSPPST